MAYPYYNSSSSEQDDISLFLQQILLRSSSSTSSSLPSRNVYSEKDQEPAMAYLPGRIHVPDSSSGLNPFTEGWFSSSSVGTLENDPDEYDCDSEEAFEGFGEESVRKTVQGRSSSKRSRAAEVHNLSEKRRRSRINEKMKALQSLIPNSNKTDKASMLDEAIEYLKQLQLQVQMLTMKNGPSLYPYSLTGVPQPDQVPDISFERSIAKQISIDNLLNPQAACPKQRYFCDSPSTIGSKDSFQLESSTEHHYEPFQLSRSSISNRRQEGFPHQLDPEYSPTTLSGLNADSKSKDGTLEAILWDVDYLGNSRIVPDLPNNLSFSTHSKNVNNGWRATNDHVKTERREL